MRQAAISILAIATALGSMLWVLMKYRDLRRATRNLADYDAMLREKGVTLPGTTHDPEPKKPAKRKG